jgi:hypothetical protein
LGVSKKVSDAAASAALATADAAEFAPGGDTGEEGGGTTAVGGKSGGRGRVESQSDSSSVVSESDDYDDDDGKPYEKDEKDGGGGGGGGGGGRKKNEGDGRGNGDDDDDDNDDDDDDDDDDDGSEWAGMTHIRPPDLEAYARGGVDDAVLEDTRLLYSFVPPEDKSRHGRHGSNGHASADSGEDDTGSGSGSEDAVSGADDDPVALAPRMEASKRRKFFAKQKNLIGRSFHPSLVRRRGGGGAGGKAKEEWRT